MDAMTLVLFVLGLVLLIAGAELLVRGSSRLAAAIGIAPLVIGLTIVAFGTSSPEMAVSVSTALTGQADLAIGNVVGSNIFNVLFILGASALIAPLVVSRQLIRLDVPIMIGVSVIGFLFALDGVISFLEGVLLFAGIVGYTAFLIVQARKDKQVANAAAAAAAGGDEFEKEYGAKGKLDARAIVLNVGMAIAGLVLLVIGSDWLVDGAISLAKVLGVDDVVIGLTIVAAGTSLPEVATSIIATIRKERDIAIGNVVGSNIFNILGILGITALIAPIAVGDAMVGSDMVWMLVFSAMLFPMMRTRFVLSRLEGGFLVASYGTYLTLLVLGG